MTILYFNKKINLVEIKADEKPHRSADEVALQQSCVRGGVCRIAFHGIEKEIIYSNNGEYEDIIKRKVIRIKGKL